MPEPTEAIRREAEKYAAARDRHEARDTATETPRPDGPVRDNAAWRAFFAHEERMARAQRPPEPSYVIEQKSPAGKTPGFEFTITHHDPDAAEAKALEWADKFPAPQPVAKP